MGDRRGGPVRFLIGGAILVLALATGLSLWTRSRVVHTEQGPLKGHGGSTTTGAATEVGRPGTYALIDLENTTDAPIILDGIRFEPPLDEDTFEILDVLVAGDEDRAPGGAFSGFPPEDLGRLEPLEGAVIPPGPGSVVNLVIGARLKQEGVGFWKAILIDYRVGSRAYTVRFDDAYVLCAPVEAWEPEGCPNPYDEDT